MTDQRNGARLRAAERDYFNRQKDVREVKLGTEIWICAGSDMQRAHREMTC
jgi:hypothetical protein